MALPPRGDKHSAATIKKAKKAFQDHRGALPLSTQDQRYADRELELYDRAAKLREEDARKKINKQKRMEKAARDAAALKKSGRTRATQEIGYDHQKAAMRARLEAFTGYKKRNKDSATGSDDDDLETDDDHEEQQTAVNNNKNEEFQIQTEQAQPLAQALAARELGDITISELEEEMNLSQLFHVSQLNDSANNTQSTLEASPYASQPQIYSTALPTFTQPRISQKSPQAEPVDIMSTLQCEKLAQAVDFGYGTKKNSQTTQETTLGPVTYNKKRPAEDGPEQPQKKARVLKKQPSLTTDYGSDWEGFEDLESNMDEVLARNNVEVRDFALEAIAQAALLQVTPPSVKAIAPVLNQARAAMFTASKLSTPSAEPRQTQKKANKASKNNIWMDGLSTQFMADAFDSLSDCSDLELDNIATDGHGAESISITDNTLALPAEVVSQPRASIRSTAPGNSFPWASTQMLLQDMADEEVDLSPVATRASLRI